MKCIELKNGVVKRVSNVVAQGMVAKGKAIYVPKREWKERTRTKK